MKSGICHFAHRPLPPCRVLTSSIRGLISSESQRIRIVKGALRFYRRAPGEQQLFAL